MSKPYAILLLLTLVLAGGYFYTLAEAVCDAPLAYRIGVLDERFGLTYDEARLAVADAESVWEQATGENLFTYNETATFPINFIFDERQQFAEAEIGFREKLDDVQGTNDYINATYQELMERYEILQTEYENRVATYERDLARYNTTVASYNEEGGAPPEAFAELEAERRQLDEAVDHINSLGRQLNNVVAKINQLSDEGNELIATYNERVDQYNETFGESREFTQGDYQGDKINIYKFIDQTELELVLAHELGHALSLGHVENPESILYDTMGGQPTPITLTAEDLAEFERVCGQTTRSFIERLMIIFNIDRT